MIRKLLLAGLFVAVSTGLSSLALAQEGGNGTLIRNVAIWDGQSDRLLTAQDVLISDNLIKSIAANIEVDESAEVIDGGGRVLMPGIIDAHTHLAIPLNIGTVANADPGYVTALSVKVAKMYLMRGWTTVRDVGGPTQGLARAINEGHIDGPRIFPSAMFISQTSGHGDFRTPTEPHPHMGFGSNPFAQRYALIADGPAEVRRAVRESLRQGATQIKLMAGGGISSAYDPIDTKQYSLEELRAAVEAAADWNTYVTVHAYTDAAVNRAIDAGVQVIEHGHLLSEATLRRMKKEGIYLSSQSFGFARNMTDQVPADTRKKIDQVMSGVDSLMSTAKDIGLPVAFGTDAFGSMRAYENGVKEFSWRELWFDSIDILRQATSHNGALLQLTGPRNPYQEGPLGIIATGAYADLLIVDGNPLEDVSLLEDHENNIRLIMKDGKIYKNTLD